MTSILFAILFSARIYLPGSDPTPGLQAVLGKYFTMGVAVSPALLTGTKAAMIQHEFGSITPENAFKMGSIHPEENKYNWKDADAIAAFAKTNGLKMRGHTLVWHNQTPDWIFKDSTGAKVSKAVLLQRLKVHIQTVVGRYKDQLYAWDVVNEAISDRKEEFLRPSPWLDICGEGYIAMAFQWAHEADPAAELYYNDYNEIDPIKREKIIRLVNQLKQKGIPIHGIGLQAHWAINEPSRPQLESCLKDFATTRLKLQVTELDISVYPKEHTARQRNASDANEDFTAAKEEKQLEQYLLCFELFRQYDAQISAVTFWNLSDRHSWLDNFPVKDRKDYPLLFDTSNNPKKAYFAILAAAGK